MSATELPPPTPLEVHAPSSRRRLLVATAACAALSGVGVAWWRSQAVGTPALAEPVDGFWGLGWDTPQGGALRMRDFQGKPLLVNFWATWCPPCVDELPLINAFYRQNKTSGLQVVGVAVDKLAAVQSFLQKLPLDFPLAMAGADGADLARRLGNLTGALPFSVMLGSDGAVAQRKIGRLQMADLDRWAQVK